MSDERHGMLMTLDWQYLVAIDVSCTCRVCVLHVRMKTYFTGIQQWMKYTRENSFLVPRDHPFFCT